MHGNFTCARVQCCKRYIKSAKENVYLKNLMCNWMKFLVVERDFASQSLIITFVGFFSLKFSFKQYEVNYSNLFGIVLFCTMKEDIVV